MQVLVALAEDAGKVVSREALFERCWGNVYVGDDSLNRAIAAIRKVAGEIAGSSFDVATIPRTGYSLTGAILSPLEAGPVRSFEGLTRRQLAGGAMGVMSIGAFGAWAAITSKNGRRFQQLLEQGDTALAGDDTEFRPDVALQSFQAAVAIKPGSAAALGRLAFAQAYFALYSPQSKSTARFVEAQATAHKALALNPREPHALQALYELQGSTLDWWTRDQRLRQIIGIDPSNGAAMFDLSSLLEASGMIRESWYWNERVLRIPPISQNCLVRRAFQLWIFGRISDADNVLNQLRAQFPASRWVWSARFIVYALTDRAQAAQFMLARDPAMLRQGVETGMWRTSLDALARRSPSAIANALEACEPAALVSSDLAGVAVMIMCALGELDSALEIANGYLVSRGSLVPSGKRAPADATVRLNTQWLFMPPCKYMRADPHFSALCEEVGLKEYWRRRRVEPDYLRLDR
jgi:tetratricopeptide (TPR) repeat protein